MRSSDGILIRLRAIDKTLLYKIFCIENQAFVSLILKMVNCQLETQKNFFSIVSNKEIDTNYLYKPSSMLMPLDKIMFSIKRDTLTFNGYANKNKLVLNAKKVN